MGSLLLAERTSTNVALTLSVTKVGGVAGLTTRVAIRDGDTIDSYLDWDDAGGPTFKTVGWVTRQKLMSDLGGGFYALSGGLDVSAITNLPAGTAHLVVEYEASGAESGVATDVISLTTGDKLREIWQLLGLDSTKAVVYDKTTPAGDATIKVGDLAPPGDNPVIVQDVDADAPGAGDKTVTRTT